MVCAYVQNAVQHSSRADVQESSFQQASLAYTKAAHMLKILSFPM